MFVARSTKGIVLPFHLKGSTSYPNDQIPTSGKSFPSQALALLYYYQGRYTDGEPLYIKALEIASSSLGKNHPNTINFRENLKYLRDNRQSMLVKVVSFIVRLWRRQ